MTKKEYTKNENIKKEVIDTTSGSMAYNRLDMQVSQVLHMAIELYDKLDYLFIHDYYDDITLFEDENNSKVILLTNNVSHDKYQSKEHKKAKVIF